MSFFIVKQIKSVRKECRCYWCGERIKIGDAKTTTAMVFEGDFQSSNFHPECYEALKKWQNQTPEEEYWPDGWEMQRGKIKAKGES
jgi:hypothetical protein